MAYVQDNLDLCYQPRGGTAPRVFSYDDQANETDATLVGANYFATGALCGMRKGDLVDVVQTGTPKHKRYQVQSTSGDAATVQTVVAIT